MTANNLVIDHHRRDRLLLVADERGHDRVAAAQAFNDQVVLGSLLDELIEKLSHRQRVAVELRYNRDLSVEHAAACIGIESGAFNQLLFRARKKMRLVMEEAGAGVAGAVPVLLAVRSRLRTTLLVSSAGVEAVAGLVIAATIVVAMAVTAVPADGPANEPGSAASTVVLRELGGTHAQQRYPGEAVALGTGASLARFRTGQADATAPEANLPREPPGAVVIEVPDAVPNSDGRVTVGEDEQDRFVVSHELATAVQSLPVAGGGDVLRVDYDDLTRDVLCSHTQ